MDNKVCVKINCFKGFSYDETVFGIRNAGFKYIELSFSNNNSMGLSHNMSNEEIIDVKNDLLNKGLEVLAVGGNSYVMDEDKSKLLRNIEIAHIMGCKYVDTNVFNARNDEGLVIDDGEVIKNIEYYIPYLEKYDLLLVIELHGEYSTGKHLKRILKKVNNKHVRINYDTSNALYWGKLSVKDMVNDFEESIDYISFMHLKDKLGELHEWNFPGVGNGYIPFDKLFNILNKHHNECGLAVEIEFTEKGVKDIGEVNKEVDDSGNYLKLFGFDID